MDFDPKEIAEQIALMDFEKYSSIKLTEFYNKAWTKKDKDVVAPNLMETIGIFNDVTLKSFI